MSAMKIWMIRTLLKNTTLIMFVLLFIGFGMLAPKFLNLQNFEIILSNASYAGIIAIGMTFVLLTGGIDLSVGSIMYVSAVVTGLVVNDAGLPVSVGLAAGLLVGLAFGVFNATIITGFGIPPFIATLVTMIAGRGLGLLITKSAAVDFPDEITDLSSLRLGGVLQLNILIFVLVVVIATVFLSFTPSGRRLYAVGNDVDAAHKAGVKTQRIIASTYIVSGLCAALAGFVSISQLGRVTAGFGTGSEFAAIAAAVLGGASLFGGVGTAFPGTVLGTIMIQMIQAGLVFVNVDIYIQPIVLGGIIFFAVFVDSFRNVQLKKLGRRNIMRLSDL
jgi:ribose/xylose/arabinose/galactoside ABC-type transport system permease subunit